MGYEFLDHTADVKFVATGKTLEEAFIFVADALFATMVGENKIKARKKKSFRIEAGDIYRTLYSFVEEFIFLFDVEGFVPAKISALEYHETEHVLLGSVMGDDASKYDVSTQVKSMTYSDMAIVQEKGKVMITGVFDV